MSYGTIAMIASIGKLPTMNQTQDMKKANANLQDMNQLIRVRWIVGMR